MGSRSVSDRAGYFATAPGEQRRGQRQRRPRLSFHLCLDARAGFQALPDHVRGEDGEIEDPLKRLGKAAVLPTGSDGAAKSPTPTSKIESYLQFADKGE